MKFEDLKIDKCPICGDTIVIEEALATDITDHKPLRHCNGERWETRRFSCGMYVRHVPNFSTDEVIGGCRNNPEFIIMKKKRKEARMKLIKYIKRLDTDSEFKKSLIDDLTHIGIL